MASRPARDTGRNHRRERCAQRRELDSIRHILCDKVKGQVYFIINSKNWTLAVAGQRSFLLFAVALATVAGGVETLRRFFFQVRQDFLNDHQWDGLRCRQWPSLFLRGFGTSQRRYRLKRLLLVKTRFAGVTSARRLLFGANTP